MHYATIERKLTVFISSKINKRYKVVRKALKELLLETGMVASVYAFEKEGANSRDVKSAYLDEVSRSDVCLFLIDNADGVSDAVYAEHERARRDGIHRLYFFCNERKKTPTELQKELMNTGEVKYDDSIHDFSDFPKKAYKSVLQDIIDIYRRTRTSVSDVSSNESKMDNMQLNTFILTKDFYNQYTAESKLTQILNPYNLNLPIEDSKLINTYDDLCADFLSVVIGRSVFNLDNFTQLKNSIISMHEDYLKRIVEMRLNAVANYFSNNLNGCYQNIKNAYEEAKEEPKIPTWFLNDIVIDMRNISTAIDNLNNKILLNSEAQIILNDSPEIVYYPLLDRFDSSHKSDLLDDYFEMATQSPYSQRFDTLNHTFNFIASCFNIAVRFGSLTQILATSKRYGDTLFVKFNNTKDFKLFFELIKILITANQVKKLNSIVSAFSKTASFITSTEIDTLIKSIQTIPLEIDKISAHLMVLENFGYYFSEEQYKLETDFFFRFAFQWCGDETRILYFGDRILKTVRKNIGRMRPCLVAELLVSFFENNLRRFYDEVLRILYRMDLKQVNEKEQIKLVEYCISLLRDSNFSVSGALGEAVIALRKSININIDLLDKAVKKYRPDFYLKEYDLEVNQSNLIKHIESYIKQIDQRNQSAQESKYYGYAYSPCDVIRNILEAGNVILTEDIASRIVVVLEKTITNKVQQVDQKIPAIQLAIFMYHKYPKLSLWDDFKKKMSEKFEDILSVKYIPLFTVENKNTLEINALLMKIAFGVYSFEEVTLGFAAAIGYNESDLIYAVRSVHYFLSAVDIQTINNHILGIITNFVLSIGKEKHRDAQLFAVDCLIILSQSRLYAATVWERLAFMLDDAISDIKIKILRGIEDLKSDKGIIDYILQKGRNDNHYFVRKVAESFTES